MFKKVFIEGEKEKPAEEQVFREGVLFTHYCTVKIKKGNELGK